MSYKQIEGAKEVRLWLGQIVLPTIGILLAIPKTRNWIKSKFELLKERADKQRKDWSL